ncbi:unnamed protein product, partial [Arctogadus glacialis]
ECVTLADIGYMACKFLQVSRIATECLEEENVEKVQIHPKMDLGHVFSPKRTPLMALAHMCSRQ